ncbi:xylanase inhibitor protein 1-like [Miscanthus floridulus]|uniref:xylanase inhibitor protein 1-like n=1 Tax=Miscanthus floridulus TaxID=154761 RepID=UPI0034586E6A
MASRRCPRQVDVALLAVAFVVVACLAAGPALAKQTNQVTVFWGQNKDEGSLQEACDTRLYTTVIISFYSVFGQGRYWRGDLSGHQLSGVGADIKHCQSRGILVLLSIGGGGHDYSLPSSQSAADVADNLWNAHLGGAHLGVYRPFGDAAVDGIDFYIHNGGAADQYDELARRLAQRGVRLTASPRCGCPDLRVDRALQTGLFERIHVRFYGDDKCSFKNGSTWGVVEGWNNWTARYPKTEVYVGLAAAESGVPDGAQGTIAVYLKYLYYLLLPEVQKAGNYGGVMVWDRYEDKKTGYSGVVKGWA